MSVQVIPNSPTRCHATGVHCCSDPPLNLPRDGFDNPLDKQAAAIEHATRATIARASADWRSHPDTAKICARLLHCIDALCQKVYSEKREFLADDWKALAKDTNCKISLYKLDKSVLLAQHDRAGRTNTGPAVRLRFSQPELKRGAGTGSSSGAVDILVAKAFADRLLKRAAAMAAVRPEEQAPAAGDGAQGDGKEREAKQQLATEQQSAEEHQAEVEQQQRQQHESPSAQTPPVPIGSLANANSESKTDAAGNGDASGDKTDEDMVVCF